MLTINPFDPNITYYAAASAVVASQTTINYNQGVMYLWSDVTNTKRIEIYRITGTLAAGAPATGQITFRGCHITAENATPAGITIVPTAADDDDAPSTLTGTTGIVRSYAANPTRITDELFCEVVGASSIGQQYVLFDATKTGKPIVIRAGVGEGFEVRLVTGTITLTTPAQATATFRWTED